MKLFNKKNEKQSCCCECGTIPKTIAKNDLVKTNIEIKILGSGCAKCQALEEAAHVALKELNMDIAIDHVTDFAQIAAYGVMTTPALVINGKVISYGKVLKKDEAKELIQKVCHVYE